MELCALALIEGGTGLSSTLGVRHGEGREAPRGVVARSVPGISVGRGLKSHKVGKSCALDPRHGHGGGVAQAE